MTIQEFLESGVSKLEQAGIESARLDCLILLEDILKKDKSYLLAHPDDVVSNHNLDILNKQIDRRTNHEPLAYIRGKSEFYGRQFLVNKHTLVPRPETETMLGIFNEIYKSQILPLQKVGPFTERENVICRIVDVGTGSGAIGISVKLLHPELEVIGTDISTDCLKIATLNAKNLNADIRFTKSDLLNDLKLKDNIILLANLPYVPDDHFVNQSALFEPKIAIFGGKDGLDLYRKLFVQICELKSKPVYIFTESFPSQHKTLEYIAKQNYRLAISEDFIQVFALN